MAGPKEFILLLTPEEMSTISDGLVEMPFKRVFGLINKIQLQINDQVDKPGA
jgi:hypothetical protein